MELIHRKRVSGAKEAGTCQTKETLRDVFKRSVLLLKKARKTATFQLMQEIDDFEKYIDSVVEPNLLIGGCDKNERR